MTKIELEIHDDVLRTINKIKNVNDQGVELVIPEGSVLFDNIINLKLIEQQAESMDISVQFSTEDEAGNKLISDLEGTSESPYQPDELTAQNTLPVSSGKKMQIQLPKIHFKFPRISLPGKRVPIFLIILLLLILGAYVFYGTKTPKASAKIMLSASPLTRSITIKVKLDATTSQATNLLKGTGVETSLQASGEADTTGEKLIGEKAEGKVIIYNKSSDEITLKKGAELLYEEDNTDYKFSMDSETSIPASHQESSDPGSPLIPGEKEANVTAQDIGSGYNVDKNKALSVTKYRKSVLEAKAKDDFEGGKADKVKVVSELDRTNLSKKLLDQNIEGANIALKSKLTSPNKLITGAVGTTITKEAFSHAVGDQTDKLTLEQTVTIKGLTYSDTELNAMLNKQIDDKAPSGYAISKKDWVVKVEVLGNSTNSVLSATEADLQVTLKTLVVPIVDKDNIKKSIAGKSSSEAEKILGSVKDVKDYELTISPAVPFFKRVPKDISRIEVTVENE